MPEREIPYYKRYNYVIINDRFDKALEKLKSIIIRKAKNRKVWQKSYKKKNLDLRRFLWILYHYR